MALQIDHANGSPVMRQRENSVLNNSLGIVHGGVAAAGLELAASAALNAGRTDQPLHTASLRVNFLRQFFSGGQSRYVGIALRVRRLAWPRRRPSGPTVRSHSSRGSPHTGDRHAEAMTDLPKRSIVSSTPARLSPGTATCTQVTPTAAGRPGRPGRRPG